MTDRKKILSLTGAVALVAVMIYCYAGFKNECSRYRKVVEKRILYFNSTMNRIAFDPRIPLDEKLKIFDKYEEMLITDPEIEEYQGKGKYFMKKWQHKSVTNEVEKFYGVAYIGDGLMNVDGEKVDMSLEHWNKLNLSPESREQLGEFIEACHRYIAEAGKGKVSTATLKELQKTQREFYRGKKRKESE